MKSDAERREEYARLWLNAYHGTEPLFVAIGEIARREPGWTIPPVVVTAVVRFSADEVWKRDPALEAAVARAIAPHHRDRPLITSQLARTPEERARVRAKARAGYARTARRRRR